MAMKVMTTLVGISLIASCATPSGTGTAVGAGTGGIIGAAAGGTGGAIAGAAIGGLLGYGVGRSVEIENERRMQYALEADRRVQWSNPDTGYYYSVEPRQMHYERGRPCREFRMLTDIEGRPREVFGTACRRYDGSWEVVSTSG